MWLLNALRRVTLPVPVTLKRFAADRLVFILGIFITFVRYLTNVVVVSKLFRRTRSSPSVRPSFRPYLGASTIVMLRPSSFGCTSTLARSCNSSRTRANTS